MSCCCHFEFCAIAPQIFPVGAAAIKRAVGLFLPQTWTKRPGNKVLKKNSAPDADAFY